MESSKELLEKIRDCGEHMLTPQETACFLGMDEMALPDKINTLGTPERASYMKGVMNTVYKLRQDMLETAKVGSPFALTQCVEMINRAMNESNM